MASGFWFNVGFQSTVERGAEVLTTMYTESASTRRIGIVELFGAKSGFVTANAAHAMRVSRPNSRIAVYVIPTDEELMIARHTLALLAARDEAKQRQA